MDEISNKLRQKILKMNKKELFDLTETIIENELEKDRVFMNTEEAFRTIVDRLKNISTPFFYEDDSKECSTTNMRNLEEIIDETDIPVLNVSDIKKRIKYSKNLMERKQWERMLNDEYKRRNKHGN